MSLVVLMLWSFPALKAEVARGAKIYSDDVVMLAGAVVGNLLTQKHLQSHRAGKRCEFCAESLEVRLRTQSAEPKQQMTGDGIALLHV
jgi:hypothetical protein